MKRTSVLRKRMIADLRLRNYSRMTQKSYVYQVAAFGRWLKKSPDKANREEIRAYLVYLQEEKKASLGHYKVVIASLRFFFKHTLDREWLSERIKYPRRERRLPVVLSREEIVRLLSYIRDEDAKVVLECCYGAGLRLGEALSLRVNDIDSNEMRLRIMGKGARERYAMLSPELLRTLREHWKRTRPQDFMFPGGQDGHISRSRVSAACRLAKMLAGIKRKVTPHVLRHSFATHLLEQGVDIRVIQELLGHTTIYTTEIYLEVSTKLFQKVPDILDALNRRSTAESERAA